MKIKIKSMDLCKIKRSWQINRVMIIMRIVIEIQVWIRYPGLIIPVRVLMVERTRFQEKERIQGR